MANEWIVPPAASS